jgi:hypothetical protein
MGRPGFRIINGERAVKAVPAEDGGIAVPEYCPEEDEYPPALALRHRPSFGDSDTDFVSEDEFEAFVAKQRAGAKFHRESGLLGVCG